MLISDTDKSLKKGPVIKKKGIKQTPSGYKTQNKL